jgi:two-component system, response regulator
MSLESDVLVVEDSDEDFETLCEVVQHLGLGCKLHRTINGDKALALLRAEHEGFRLIQPRLILLDLNAPGSDGRETLAALKSDATLRPVSVVVLTTSANPADVAFCYAAGANSYHVKPVRHDSYLIQLAAVLQYWLGTALLAQPSRTNH